MAFNLTEEKKKSQEIGRWERWSHLTKLKYWSGEEKIPPEHDWWVGSVWKNHGQWGAKRRASGRFYTCQCSTKGHECEILSWKKITISIFLRQVSLCKVRLVRTLCLNWNQRHFALHVERQEDKKLLFKNWRKKKNPLEIRLITNST